MKMKTKWKNKNGNQKDLSCHLLSLDALLESYIGEAKQYCRLGDFIVVYIIQTLYVFI